MNGKECVRQWDQILPIVKQPCPNCGSTKLFRIAESMNEIDPTLNTKDMTFHEPAQCQDCETIFMLKIHTKEISKDDIGFGVW
jgi:uncharacterized protein (DUF983 family)